MVTNKLTIKAIDDIFKNVQDEYDFNLDMKDKLKEVLREAINFGYNLAIEEIKKN